MAVDSRHPDYVKLQPTWEMLRDLADGDEDELKKGARRQRYLPPLSGHAFEMDSYERFVASNHLFNGLARVLELVISLLFRKAGKFVWPAKLKPLMEDVTGQGDPFEIFSEEAARELFLMNRIGILTEYPKEPGVSGLIFLDRAERLGLRPYWIRYEAENIVNWDYRRVGARRELILVVLAEESVQRDGFDWKTTPQFKVLDLDGGGNYRQRRFQLVKKDGAEIWSQVGSDLYPRANGRFLRHIPFRILGPPKQRRPIMTALGHSNIAHWRNSALYYQAMLKVAVPQFYTAGRLVGADTSPTLLDMMVEKGLLPQGFDPQALLRALSERPIRLGVDYALQFEDEQGKAGYAEFTGQGLGALRLALADLREEMVAQGARIIAPDKLAPETATTEKLRRSESNSVLQRFGRLLSLQMRGPVQDMLLWAGEPEAKFDLEYNLDFFDQQLTGKEVLEFVSAHMRGGLPLEDLYQILQKGEVLRHGLTFAQYVKAIEAERLESPLGTLIPESAGEDEGEGAGDAD